MLKKAKTSNPKPTADHIERFVKHASSFALEAETPSDWYKQVTELIEGWAQ